MKNNILLTGVVLTILNTIIGVVLSDYSNFNMVFADVSILTSTGMVYYLFQSTFADGFKIGFTVLFAITGLIRLVCSAVSPEQFADNIAFLVFIIFLALEGLCFFVGKSLKDK